MRHLLKLSQGSVPAIAVADRHAVPARSVSHFTCIYLLSQADGIREFTQASLESDTSVDVLLQIVLVTCDIRRDDRGVSRHVPREELAAETEGLRDDAHIADRVLEHHVKHLDGDLIACDLRTEQYVVECRKYGAAAL